MLFYSDMLYCRSKKFFHEWIYNKSEDRSLFFTISFRQFIELWMSHENEYNDENDFWNFRHLDLTFKVQ